jgi:hypothetical protein
MQNGNKRAKKLNQSIDNPTSRLSSQQQEEGKDPYQSKELYYRNVFQCSNFEVKNNSLNTRVGLNSQGAGLRHTKDAEHMASWQAQVKGVEIKTFE